VWIVLFIVAGLYTLLCVALGSLDPILMLARPEWSPLHWSYGNLGSVFAGLSPVGGIYWPIVSRTIIYIAIALGGTILIGYPVAYFVTFHAGRYKALLLILLATPFLVSYMLRMLAWVGLLAPDGYVNRILVHAGVIQTPVNWLGGQPAIVVLALIYGWVPYFIFPLYASLERLDTVHMEAASDLGASNLAIFLHVTLPLSRPGIIAGAVIVGLPMFGDFYTNTLVSGSSRTTMIGNLINFYVSSETQQIVGAALAVALMLFLGVLLFGYVRSSGNTLEGI
jgi:spermidine/putrescine transport system permease protein